MTDNAKNYHEKMFPGYVSDFYHVWHMRAVPLGMTFSMQ